VSGAALKRAKRRLRRDVLERRDALDPDARAAWGALATDRLLALPELTDAGAVMAFWSFGSEVPTDPLIAELHERGANVALPRIEGGDIVAVAFVPGQETRTTSFGAREPLGPALVPATLDVVVVPGVAFDRGGRRIGYGAGYYDRFLPRTGAFAVAIAFSIQVLDEPLPAGNADVPVDAIVTERETIRPRA
jgi:5-formyltetrahydrofolate cyclo-ligase